MSTRLLLAVCSLHLTLLAGHAAGGGTVIFSHRLLAYGVDAPVFHLDGVTRLEGDAFRVQLYAGPSPDGLAPVGAPVAFRTGQAAGYFTVSESLEIASVPAGEPAFLQVRAWEIAAGDSFEAASAAGGLSGASKTFELVTGGGGVPPGLPAALIGLESFQLEGSGIVRQPVSQTAFEESPVRFEVEAISTRAVTYQWQHNGVDLPGATGPVLELIAAPELQGEYRAILADGARTLGSRTALLTVIPVPAGAAVYFGNRFGPANFSVPVMNLENGQRLGDGFVAQLFAGTSADDLSPVGEPTPFGARENAGFWEGLALAIPDVEPGQEVFVQVRVWEWAKGATYEDALAADSPIGASEVYSTLTGGGGEAPALLPLERFFVGLPPKITQQPASLYVRPGDSVSLTVEVRSLRGMSLQWQFNGVDLPGETAPSLQVASVDATKTGAYRVIVSNPVGSVTSQEATLTVPTEMSGGTIRFVWPEGAEVYDSETGAKAAGPDYLAQLWAGPTRYELIDVTPPVPFFEEPNAGRWDPGEHEVVVLPNVAPGLSAYLQVRVWEASAGSTFEEALSASTKTALSAVFSRVTGGFGTPPSPPGDLSGLPSLHLGNPGAGFIRIRLPGDGYWSIGTPVTFPIHTSPIQILPYQKIKSLPIQLVLERYDLLSGRILFGTTWEHPVGDTPVLFGSPLVRLDAPGSVVFTETSHSSSQTASVGAVALFSPQSGRPASVSPPPPTRVSSTPGADPARSPRKGEVLKVASASQEPPRILAPRYSGSAFIFDLQTHAGQTWLVEYAESLSAPEWRLLQTVTGDGSRFVVADPTASSTQRYYRLRAP